MSLIYATIVTNGWLALTFLLLAESIRRRSINHTTNNTQYL
jgi:hypothetical protein